MDVRYVLKKAECWRTDAFELWCWRTPESPLDSKEIQWVHLKGNQSWIFIGRTDSEAEIPILWLPDVKNWLIWKASDAGKDWRQEEKGTTEDEMVGWHHQLDGHEFEQAPGVGDGQGSLACCRPWGRKELDTTESLHWTERGCSAWGQLLQQLLVPRATHLSWLCADEYLCQVVPAGTSGSQVILASFFGLVGSEGSWPCVGQGRWYWEWGTEGGLLWWGCH